MGTKTFSSTTAITSSIDTTNLVTAFYSTTSKIGSTVDTFPLNSVSRACHGGYGTTSTSRVGIIEIPNLEGGTLKNTDIKTIKLTFTCAKAGSATASRKMTLRKSGVQGMDSTKYPSNYVGDVIGTFTGNFYNGSVTLTFSESSNASAFAILKEYFEAGNTTLVVYNGEKSSGSSGSFSTNYLVVEKLATTITYEENAYVYYNDNGTAKKCAVYYNDNGNAVRCSAYYNDNGNAVKV